MTGPRTAAMRHDLVDYLVTAITAAGSDADVYAYPAVLDNLTRPAVLLAPTHRSGPAQACPSGQLDLEVLVVSPITTPGPADDALDDALDVILDALLTYPGTTLDPATRGVYLNAWPCWTLPIGLRR
jgi:hypothetical protein